MHKSVLSAFIRNNNDTKRFGISYILRRREVISGSDDGKSRTTIGRGQRFDRLLQAATGPGFREANHSVKPRRTFETI